ncbi:UDP-glucose 4-epimerase [Paenibacillus selenitireducens]|uniref:UDP-glucose 4-epimerase n=1 Tax=Paenibacillus selenitireducens TaxID=1324314 RepID=A0A1T2XBY4_9BACL|nr:NAD-dependent epimerase/dehydratase family protein [Paenibacillus selenitireducens]OPA77404.1 UDP-glucose 4-epimerase [Paenibacillus selenitireducens]
MSRILVTGAAGFIGSHLCEELLQDESNQVIGLDAFIDFTTPIWMRKRNIGSLLHHPRFEWVDRNLLTVSWGELLAKVDIIYHLAGMPGVRSSWGPDFVQYANHNIVATQRLLEACKGYPLQRFIFASTSSVYGEKKGRVDEQASTLPLSPYGISKLTCEHLCRVYGDEGIPVVILRFFTVYGPRQRPDMAFHRFIKQMLDQQPITLYGDGTQSRDFTYVADCVKAIAAVAHANGVVGETINIGGKERASINQCIALLEQLFDQKAQIEVIGNTFGEPTSTWADVSKAELLLGYSPSVDLKTGLSMEIQYLREMYQ